MKRTHRWLVAAAPRRSGVGVTLVALVALALTAPGTAAAQPYFLFDTLATDLPLEFSNASKIVVGRFNILHAVYVSGGEVYYATSTDGAAWTPPVLLSADDQRVSRNPSIAVDGAGRVGVVWVDLDGYGTGYGDMQYAYRTPGSLTWTTTSVASGAEPALISSGTTMHLTWTDLRHVFYTSFPTIGPVTSTVSTVDTASCSGIRFRKPSIVVSSAGCSGVDVTIAYLAYAETVAGCIAPMVSARVRRKPSAGAWPQLYNWTVLASAFASSDPVSLSLSANRATGDLFLAWSYSLGGAAKTLLTRGLGTLWTPPVQLASTARHVHVRAVSSPAAPATQFQLAWTAAGSTDPYYGTSTYVDAATWAGASPIWTGATLLSTLGAGRPQAVAWKRCVLGAPSPVLAETRAYFEATFSTGGRKIATDLVTTAGCPVVSPGVGVPCGGVSIALASLSLPGQGPPGSIVDVAEVGVITRVSQTSATVQTSDGRVVTISWRSGSAVASSDSTLTVTAPSAELSLRSRDVAFSVVDVGYLREYDVRTVP